MTKLQAYKTPIFILGIMPRSGTNFLHRLLDLHPQCIDATNKQIPEDFLLFPGNLLVRYAEVVSNYHHQYWKYLDAQSMNRESVKSLKEKVCKCLGDGLISYLKEQNENDDRRLLTKTPSVQNLKYFFKIFPKASLLILIRDGRNVVESAVKSFGWSYEVAMQNWAEAAQTIIDFQESHSESDFKYALVKYEDLLDNLEEELSRIFKFLDLDSEVYNFSAASNLPIMGSSQFWNNDGTLGWREIEKTEAKDFAPKSRAAYWPRFRRDRFSWIAGKYMVQLGYNYEITSGLISNFVNRILDRQWQLRTWTLSKILALEKIISGIYVYKRNSKRFPLED